MDFLTPTATCKQQQSTSHNGAHDSDDYVEKYALLRVRARPAAPCHASAQGHVFSAANAYTALALFNLLRLPLASRARPCSAPAPHG